MARRDRTDVYGVKQSEQEIYENSARNQKGAFHRSGYYHRFFEGWSEYSVEVPGKGRRIRRVYTAPWKVQEGNPGKRIRRKILYALLLLASAFCFVFAGTRYTGSNAVWYTAVVQFIVTILYILAGGACLFYALSPRRMTIYQWKSTSGLLKSLSLSAAIGLGMLSLAVGIFLLTNTASGLSVEIGNIALYLMGAGFLLAVFSVENHTKYLDVENENELPQSGTMIR